MITPWQFMIILFICIFFFYDINTVFINIKKNIAQFKLNKKDLKKDREED
jgi:hypothetical protein